MNDIEKLSAVKAVFLDMDGTIYHGSKLYPTTLPFLEFLKKHNIKTLAATPHTDYKYTDVDLTCGVAMVVGAEQTGLTDFWMDGADLKVVIPMLGKIDSLNVATATTLLLYEAVRQRGFKK